MNITLNDKTFEPFIEFVTIEKRTRLMGIQINVDYENRTPVFVGVLNGSFMFMADLLKEIEIPCEVTFVKVASYNGATKSSGEVKLELELTMDLKGRDVIIVEDIVDSGVTLDFLLQKFNALLPNSVRVATLLFKPKAMKIKTQQIEYVGFEIENDFVVGYGLDYQGLGRNLTDIYRLCED